MRFIFHANASKELGSGHVMRISALAEEAVSRGIECFFMGKIENLPWVEGQVTKLGFKQILTSFDDFTPDAEEDVLILDSYTLPVTNKYITNKYWKLIVTISDDFTPEYLCNIKIKPSLIKGGKDENCILLSGPDYILARKSIRKKKNLIDAYRKFHVLVIGGGTDIHDFSFNVAKFLDKIDSDFHVSFFTNKIIKSSTGKKFTTYEIGNMLDEVSQQVDLVLTTASTSSLEFIAREIPLGVVCAVGNQSTYYEELGMNGFAEQLGVFEKGKWSLNFEKMENLIMNKERRNEIFERIRGLIDLKGTSRVLDEIIKHTISN